MQDKRVCVVAGNEREYLGYLLESGLTRHQAHYVADPYQLMDMVNFRVVRVGTWHTRSDEEKDLIRHFEETRGGRVE